MPVHADMAGKFLVEMTSVCHVCNNILEENIKAAHRHSYGDCLWTALHLLK